MIYNEEYKIKFYKNSQTGREPAREYINSLDEKCRLKIYKYIEYLRSNQGYISEPYSKHIIGKIRELRVDFANNHHRILYFSFINKTIILLSAFTKKTTKTPINEILIAINYYNNAINNPKIYED
jgi:phage-related protein